MKRVGIAGFQLADVNFGSGQTVDPPVDFGSPEWLEALRHAAVEAERLDLEMAIFSSPGWSMTGGPWVKPHQAMKKLVWSETQVTGPGEFDAQLPQPPTDNGPFQDIGASRNRDPEFYKDVRVIAFPTPSVEVLEVPEPTVTCSSGPLDAAMLRDELYDKRVVIKLTTESDAAWIQYEFEQPVTIRAVTIGGDAGIPVGRVSVSDDGNSFRTLVSLPGSQLYRQGRVRTFAIPPTTGRHFRLEMTAAPLGPAATMSEEQPVPAKEYSLIEWRLHPGARIHRWEEKAGFGHLFEYETVAGPQIDGAAAIPQDKIIDLTSLLKADGTLNWKVPSGHWTVLRLGYSLTGAKNRPATPAGLGYEVDKLSREHTEAYYDGYATPMKEKLGDLYGTALGYFLIDSWEAGQQNWTDDMIGEFIRLRGYDPTPYLPAMTGHVVESVEASDRFLWDFRRTLADMFAENHYAVMVDKLHRDGLQVYSEASGVSLEIPEDTLLNKSKVDVPMGEFWMRDLHPRLMYLQDVRGAASAAHAYGKPIVAAESFTGGGYESPFSLKKASDYWLAQGINRLIFHTSAHQPLDTKPGNTMVGTHLHRNISWAELAKPLNEYFARICFLLQQGKPVVDVAYLLNEGAPSTMPIWGAETVPAPPEGYQHDFINVDVLLNRITVGADGKLLLPDGMSYQLLVLSETDRMRPEVLEKLYELVKGGATICGPKPRKSPSLDGQPVADQQVAELAETLWGDLNGTTRTINYVGKGMAVWGRSLEDVLTRISLAKDFEWAGPLDADIAWTHRQTDSADIYYVSNLMAEPFTLQARVRVKDRAAELWRPDTSEIQPIKTEADNDRTTVSFPLEGNETLFVVLRDRASAAHSPATERQHAELTEISGAWKISFPPDLGAPAEITLAELKSWTEHEESGVQYFSGTAAYKIGFDAPQEWFNYGRQFILDLGEVRDIAEVFLNDKNLGVLWKPPFRVNITSALKKGANQLKIRVTNQWTNRIVGDRNSAEDERVLTGVDLESRWGPRESQPSGLLGPAKIYTTE